jgi:transcriptional regulator of acetoin/glycerol metabolism
MKGVVPAGVGEVISNSWLRAKDSLRIDPATLRPGSIETTDALQERCRWDEVFGIVLPVLRDFAGRLDLSDHALAYFDREGWMLSIDGDPRVLERLEEIYFHPGTNWAEGSAGTNGPGTALAEGRPVEVFASEHYIAAWQQWSCAAAPIRLFGVPEPIGIVDITGPWDVRRRQALVVIQAIARAIQERIQAATSVRDEVVRYAFRAAHEVGDALIAVDARGRVIALNDAAARRKIVGPGALPLGMRDTITQAFRGSAQGEVSLVSPDGLPIVASVVRHENSAVGAILRVLESGGTHRIRKPLSPSARYDFSNIQGRSKALAEAVRLARAAASNELPVILSGESGTGKELFAHSIHAASNRRAGPFVPVNCGGLPPQLIEAELFGYEAGAFTGAKREGNIGRCELADGGTLFLDEVSELPPSAQTALLRVLQEREIVRLGGFTPRMVNVRVVAASNKPLEEEIRAKRFREDLYYRLNVLSIPIPPLRDRKGDVPLLAQVFLIEAEAGMQKGKLEFAPDALEALSVYAWPGNVRELKNAVMRASATAPQALIRARDLLLTGNKATTSEASNQAANTSGQETSRSFDRDELLAAISACDWNLAQAARQLGISRMTLYRWIKKHAISREGGPV